MHETASLKTFRLTAKLEVVSQNFFRPVFIVAQMRDHIVVPVEERDPGMEVRTKQNVALNIDVGWEREAVHDAGQLSVEREILQSSIRAIANGDLWLTLSAVVQPQPVRSSHLARLGPFPAPGSNPVAVFVVLMHEVRAVPVGHVETAVRLEADIGRRKRRFLPVVLAGFDREFLSPDFFALERRLAEVTFANARQIKKLFAAVPTNIDTVPRSVMLFSERPNAFAVAIKDDDRIANRFRFRTVRDVDQPFRIDRRSVSVLPLDRIRHLAPVVMAFVNEVAFSNDGRLRTGFVRGVKKRRSDGRSDGRSARGLQKSASAGWVVHQ